MTMGENLPLPARVIRMAIPEILMDHGKSYGPLDLARDCGCGPCQEFLMQHERLTIAGLQHYADDA